MTREEAIKWLKGIQGCYKKKYFDLNLLNELCVEAIDLAIESLSAEPIRCEDCRHAEHREQMPNQIYCHRDKLSTHGVLHDDDDFCKYGERREDDEN